MVKKFDLIIVGHGITGAVLHLKAKERGLNSLIIDQAKNNHSSSVAVGLFHPMAFRRTVFGWMGLEVFKNSKTFYERHIPKHFTEIPLYRVFADTEEYNRWFERMGEDAYTEVLELAEDLADITAPNGLGKVNACAKINVQEFLSTQISSLKEEDKFIDTRFPHDKVDIATNSVNLRDEQIHFKNIIFCEGLGVKNNPWFDHLRFHPAKGDVLKVKLQKPINAAVNKRHFIAPAENEKYWLGATYDWKKPELSKDEEAKKELEETATKFLGESPRTTDHLVGIRPASYDRRPFIGLHDDHPQLGVLNGMGSKAVMLAPYCADILLDHMLNKAPIPKDLDIKRLNKFRKP